MTLVAGREIELEIEGLAAGGDGIGRHGGRAIFVPRTVPGDRVWARVTEVRARFARAEQLSIRSPGPARRPAPCPHYERCGGCSWLHMDEAQQSAWRIRILRDALERIAKRTHVPEVEHVASPRALGYRARARVAYASGQVGFRARRSKEIVEIERCVVLDDATQAELERLQSSPPSGDGECEIRGFGDRAAGLRVSPGAFFQANGSLWRAWASRVAECCGEGSLLLELFAGVGFYTVELLPRFERVIAVEQARCADDLRHNVPCEVHGVRVEDFFASPAGRVRPDVVLLNPPRVGCAPEVMHALRCVGAPRIVYVSCDPATLGRDLARLGSDYEIVRVVALDAMPQTHHVESIVVLESS